MEPTRKVIMDDEALSKGRCCICLGDGVIGVECEHCLEGKCCWPCSLEMAEAGLLDRCPVCREEQWREDGVASSQPRAIGTSYRGRESWEYYDEQYADETVCLHIVYVVLCGMSSHPTRALRVLLATWLQGLSLVAIYHGDLAAASTSSTISVLCAGEIASAICALTAALL